MRVISKVKAITMAEKAAPSNKTRIVVLADVIESVVVVFDGFRPADYESTGTTQDSLELGNIYTIGVRWDLP